MGWIGNLSCIPGHLALAVFLELRNLSVKSGKTDYNCLFRAFDFSQSSERVLPSDFSGATPLESCFECLSSEYIFLIFTLGGLFSSC